MRYVYNHERRMGDRFTEGIVGPDVEGPGRYSGIEVRRVWSFR